MSSPAADQIEGSLPSKGTSPAGSYPTTSPNIPNQESLPNKDPDEASTNSLQSSFDDSDPTGNDPSDVKAYATNTKAELDTSHDEISHLAVPGNGFSGDLKSTVEGNPSPDSPPENVSPPPTCAASSSEERGVPTAAESNIPTSSENALPTLAEKGPHVLDTVSISSPRLRMAGGAQTGAREPEGKDSFDIFDSNDHDTLGNGRCRSPNSPDGSISIVNGFVSPKRHSVSPPPSGRLVTPAPKNIASILTPPSSGEKSSTVSPCSLEIAPDVSPLEKESLFTLSHEEDRKGDVHTLERNDLSPLAHQSHSGRITPFLENDHFTPPHEENHYGDVTPFEESGHYTLPHEENYSGGVHTLEQNNLSPFPHENHYGGVSPFKENGHSILPQEENHNGHVYILERNDLSPPLLESYSGGVTPLQENNHFTSPREENHYSDVTPFEENDHCTLPHEGNHHGDVHTSGRNDLSPPLHESHSVGVTPFQENDHFSLPHEENRDRDVHTLGQNGPSALPHEEGHCGVTAPFEENHHFTLPHEENNQGDFPTPNKFPREPKGTPGATNGREKNNRRQPRGDYWRPPITDPRTRSDYRNSYRHRETESSNHRSRPPQYNFNSSHHSAHENSGRDRPRSPARDIKRGRLRDPPPPHGSKRSPNIPYCLSGANSSHQAEDRSTGLRFGTRTFNGDRYIPPEPTRPARRSPAPSPGRELTPPRHIPRKRSRSRPPRPVHPEHRSSRYSEHTPSNAHPIRSSRALPDQSIAFQSSTRSLNTVHRSGAGNVFEGGHSVDMRNPNYPQARVPTSPGRPGKRRLYGDEPPAQHKRSRRDEQSHIDGNMREHKAPRWYGPR